MELGGFSAWVVAQAGDLSFERRAISLRREGPAQARTHKAFQCSMFAVLPKQELVAWVRRLISPEWGLLAWTRLVQGRVPALFSSVFWVFGYMIEWFTIKAWSMMLHMFNRMKWSCYMLCLAWSEIWISWLVEHWHEIIMLEIKVMVMVWGTWI